MSFRLNGWESQDAQKLMIRSEAMIKQVYHENLVSKEDLKVRDTVINRVKDAFFNAAKKDYPQLLDGEITVSGTGSAMNGLWTS